jgi:hypothetical protein
MSPTGTTAAQSTNGSAASTAAAKAREAGGSVASAAKSAKGPALAAGATVAGLASGLVLGTRMSSSRRKVLGLPIGRKRPMVRAAEALGKVAKELGSATGKAAATTQEVREVRDQLERVNRQSPVEVLLDGLTHRRGAHKRES